MAIEDCLRVAEFGDLLILTDDQDKFRINGDLIHCDTRFYHVPDWPEKVGWSRSWWFDVPPLLRTRQTLNIQWDSWICNPDKWKDEFLDYDYIGAPWWYRDGKNVGNGGFSLVSSRLKRYIADRRWDYPCDTPVDDDLLCRTYRPKLEEVGFTWAPESIACDFAFETSRPSKDSRHFGFHAAYNWPIVLDTDALVERLNIVKKIPAIYDSWIMKEMVKRYPDVTKLMEN